VGFFYFSGWRELYEALRRAAESNLDLKLRILGRDERGSPGG